jgi:hypothetical protein
MHITRKIIMAKYRISEIIRRMESSIEQLKDTQKNAHKNLSQIKEMKSELASLREDCLSNISHLFLQTVDNENYKAYGLFLEEILNKKDYITIPLNNYNQKIDDYYQSIRFHKRNIIEQNELKEQTLSTQEVSEKDLSTLAQQKTESQNQLNQITNLIKNTQNKLPEENSIFYEIKSIAKDLGIELNDEQIIKIKEDSWQFKFKKTFAFSSNKLKNEIKLHNHLLNYDELSKNKYSSDATDVQKIEKELQSLNQEQTKIEQITTQLKKDHAKTLNLVNHCEVVLSEIAQAIKTSEQKQATAEAEEKNLSSNKESILYADFLSSFNQQIKSNPNVLFNLDNKIRNDDINYQIISPNLKKAVNNPIYIENLNQFKDTMVLEQELSKGEHFNNDMIKKVEGYITNIEKNLKKLKKAPSKSNTITFKMTEFEQSIDNTSNQINQILNNNKYHLDLNQQFKNDYFYRKELNQNIENETFLNNYIYYMLAQSIDKNTTASFMGINQQSLQSINLDNMSVDSSANTNIFNSNEFNSQLNDLCQSSSLTTLMGIEDSFACFDKINDALSNMSVSDNSSLFNSDTFTMPDLSSSLDINISSNTFDSLSSMSFDTGSSSSSSWDSSSSSSFDFGSSSSSYDSSSSSWSSDSSSSSYDSGSSSW